MNNPILSDSESEDEMNIESIDLEEVSNFMEMVTAYKDYYKEKIEIVKIKMIFLNNENRIVKVSNEDIILKNLNVINSEDLFKVIVSNSKIMEKKYKVQEILLYNVTIDPDDICNIKNESYLSKISHLNDIKMEPTISILQDLNEILIIFQEAENKRSNKHKTYKVKLNPLITKRHRKTHKSN